SFDEAQMLRFLEGGKGRIDFRRMLAYAYDNLRGLRFILTGSEVGLLLSFLRLEELGVKPIERRRFRAFGGYVERDISEAEWRLWEGGGQ
ncbi:MAG: ATP-binding protein, partial [Candidatus Bathyarchaeia archaeon]